MINMSYVKIVDTGYTCLSTSALSSSAKLWAFVGGWPALMLFFFFPGKTVSTIFHDPGGPSCHST